MSIQAQNKASKQGYIDEILSLEEVSEWLKITPRAVVKFGIPHYQLGHKTKLFKRDDVLNWLETKREA